MVTRWELDHINPLSEQKNVPRDKMDWSYWSMESYRRWPIEAKKKIAVKRLVRSLG